MNKEAPGIFYNPSKENFTWLVKQQAKYRGRNKYFGLSRLVNIVIGKFRKKTFEKENG